MQRRQLLVAMAVIAVLLIGYALLMPKADTTLIGEVTATRVVHQGTPTDAAYVDVSFTRIDDSYAVANVGIDLNLDGVIAAYALPDGTMQEEWVVRDGRAKAIEGGNSFSFTLSDRDVDGRKGFTTLAMLTKTAIEDTERPPRDRAVAKSVLERFAIDDYTDRFSPGTDKNADGAGGDMDGPTPGPMATTKNRTSPPNADRWLIDPAVTDAADFDGAPAIGAVPATEAPAEAGADFEAFQTDVPDMAQGHNECVPTSTSNAIHGLAKRYGFEDRVPGTQRETMEELKVDMIWEDAKGGVATRTDFIPGKVAFTARHDLPIYTHQIGGDLDPDIGKKIAEELAKGQAVEIVIGFYEQNATTGVWTRHGGHMMSTVGAWNASGDTYLGFHDPGSPGTNPLDIYEIDGKRLLNYRYRGPYKVFVDRAFAESVTQEWITAHPPKTGVITSGGMVENTDRENMWFLDVIKIGNAWYPAKQFHAGTGPECDQAEHWHANAGGAWGLDFGNAAVFDLNPVMIRRRTATAVSWTDPGNCGAGKTASVERMNIIVTREEAGMLVSKIVQ